MLSCAEAWHDFNAAEAWVVVRSYCRVAIVAFDCGSALWADFFLKRILKAAGGWVAFVCRSLACFQCCWSLGCSLFVFSGCQCDIRLRICSSGRVFFKQPQRLLKIGLLSCAEARHDFNAAEAWVPVCLYVWIAAAA